MDTFKKFLIIGNWKMNLIKGEAIEFIKGLKHSAEEIKNVEIVVCPSFPVISAVFEELEKSNIKIGAQNMYFEEKGAFTGEVSARQIKSFCRYVILGHSERRNYFGETDEFINKKIITALKHGLIPIICVGEKKEEREADKTLEIISSQMKRVLQNVQRRHLSHLVFAYEPVWAIGSGLTPEPTDASNITLYIRRILSEMYDQNTALRVKILYGGSVDSKIAKSFLREPGIDGFLVGGASINLAEFARILREAEEIANSK